MHSPALAIAWEIWTARRRAFLALLAAIPACAALFHVLGDPLRQSDLLHGFSLLPMILSIFCLFVLFNYTDTGRKERLAGFPAHLFARPVRTRMLVTCPIVTGVAAVAGLYAAWVFLVYLPLGIELSLRWPLLILATAMVCYQSIIWSFAGFRLTRLIVMGVIGSILPGALIINSAPEFKGILSAPAEMMLASALVALALAAYVTALVSVEWQRRGGGRGRRWWSGVIQPIAKMLPRRSAPFASTGGARFWFEWRRNGVVLPFCVAFFLVLVIGPILFFGGRNAGLTVTVFCWILFLPFVLAGFWGKGVAQNDPWSGALTLSPFLATRPITSGEMVMTKLKVAALSAFVSWLLILLITPVWMALWCDTSLLAGFWQSFRQHYSPFVFWTMMALFFLAAPVMTCRLLVSGSWLGLWGRPVVFFSSLVLGLAGVLAVFIFCAWFFAHLDHQQAIRAVAPALKRLFQWVPWCAWLLDGLFVFKVGLAAWSWQASQRRGLLSGRILWTYVAVWLAGTLCLAALPLLFFFPLHQEPAGDPLDWVIHIGWLKYLFTLAALLLLPWARIGLAPLALASNRHR